MKKYKLFDHMHKAVTCCEKTFDKMANAVETTKTKCMVKRLQLIDKEQEFLRQQLGKNITSGKQV